MLDYYHVHAEEYFMQTFQTDMTEVYGHFLPKIASGGRLLDLGSGSGRDAIHFYHMGFEVTALEPSARLCEKIRGRFGGEVVCLPIGEYWPAERFDAVWACASLLHLPREELLNFFAGIDRYLKPGGIIYASGKNGIPTGVCEDGRFFLEFDERLLREIAEASAALKIEEVWYSRDVAGRNDFQWMNFILKFIYVPCINSQKGYTISKKV